jgi:signal peptidase I
MLDFEAIIVAVTLISGVVWSFDRLRRRHRDGSQAVSWWVDLGRHSSPYCWWF